MTPDGPKPNIHRPVFDEPREHPGFNCERARLGRQAGSEKTSLSLWRIPPGEAAYPYHWHAAEEELVIVLEGTLSLRTREGWSELARGDVICFPIGEAGAHQIANRGRGEASFLAFSNQQPDLLVFPDSDKLGAYQRLPEGGGFHLQFRREDGVDYFEGEAAP